MSGLPWLRLYAEFAYDPEIQALAFEDQRHFVMALCLKCSGVLDKIRTRREDRERILKRALGLDSTAFDEATKRLVRAGLIDEKWQPKNWDKRQYVSDSSTSRVRKHRDRKKNGADDETFQQRPQRQSQKTDTEEHPPPPLQGGEVGVALTDPFTPTDPFHLNAKQRAAIERGEKKVQREVLKRTRVDLDDKPDAPHKEIADLYRKICVPQGFLDIAVVSVQRIIQIKLRWYEDSKRQRLEWWEAYFTYVANRCQGLRGRDWANFGFLISDKMVDITEGKYEQALTR